MVWIVLALAVAVAAFVYYMSSTHNTFKKMNIDTPPTSWLLGNIYPFMKDGFFSSQEQFYKQFKDKKVYGMYDLRTPVLVVKDLDMIKDIMVTSFNSFVNRHTIDFSELLRETPFYLEGSKWRYVRKVIGPAFSSGSIKRMAQHVERKSEKLVAFLQAKHERNEAIELKDIMTSFVTELVAITGFDLDINAIENPDNIFAIQAKKCFAISPFLFLVNMISPFFIKCFHKIGISMVKRETLSYFIRTVDSAMERRKREGQAGKFNDFMDLLIDASSESGLTEKSSLTKSQIHGQALAFIVGGFHSISTALSFTLFLLAQHPEYCKKVQKEIDEKIGNEVPNYENTQSLTYMEMCINESMRIYPPGPVTFRVCNESTNIQGIYIPKGMTVSFPIYTIHHDPQIWPDPEKFQPERFSNENKESRHPYAFIPFGYGPRACLGMRIAVMELRVALTFILKKLTPVSCEKTVYPIRLDKFEIKAEDGLWVKFEKRQ